MTDEHYNPKRIEAIWYDEWNRRGFFEASTDHPGPTFTMMMPPPNVTGLLHIGHALTNALEDSLARWHRMRGHNVLWLPGLDHAGIATQVVVEKMLMRKEGKSRHDLGREEFLRRVWQWKEESGGTIFKQMHRLGISCDWSRSAFTMDEKCSRAVQEAFIRLYNNGGKIFRATRIINWDCVLNTAVSNIEVDYEEFEKRTRKTLPGYAKSVLFGAIWEFAYMTTDGQHEVVIATTRPETMLGDTAIAVHPDDPRHRHLIGQHVRHPFYSDRVMPIVGDPILVQIGLGTGAVKITPAHDQNDYDCAKRHGLEFINILNDNGTICLEGEFHGLHRWEARDRVVKRLTELGLFREVKDHKMSVAICSRSGDVLEPRIKPQWFVDCSEMARRGSEAVRSGALRLIPDTPYNAQWEHWMQNTGDWCISRQLWWGHRVPAYLVHLEDVPNPDSSDGTYWVVGQSEEDAMDNARAKFPGRTIVRLEQDPDVLDTWFSSALFPFSTLGWPDVACPDMRTFFPGSLLETGWDILFFWVAKMVFLSQELTGQLPFKEVFLHPMIRDAEGQKMSKTLGNVVDPIDVMDGASMEALAESLRTGNLDPKKVAEGLALQRKVYGPTNGIPECGADALRFALCNYTGFGANINLNIRTVLSCRHFCDKLWNIVRFVLIHAANTELPECDENMHLDLWILSRLSHTVAEVNDNLEAYNFCATTTALQKWWRDDFADTYLEACKPNMTRERVETLLYCLNVGLRLLHPFMPFLTEELWHMIPRDPSDHEFIMMSEYPEPVLHAMDPELESEFGWVNVTICQRIRSEWAIRKYSKKDNLTISICTSSPKRLSVLNIWLPCIRPLVRCQNTIIQDGLPPSAPDQVVLSDDCIVFFTSQ